MIEGKSKVVKTGVLRQGLVGGGTGSFIGDVHRKAAAFDGKAQMVAGCFSRDWEVTQATGQMLGLNEDRIYKTYAEMAQAEGAREDGIDFVSICTPNYAHYDIAKAFMEQNIHIICDKPLALTLEQGEELTKIAKERYLLFCVTYAYSAHPVLYHAREMVRNGELGDIRVVVGEYPQCWLADKLEDTGQRQAAWRTDPKMAGISNCVGDIGSHIEHTVSFVTGLKIKSLCANLTAFGENRELDTNAEILVRLENGGTGSYWCSQVAIGNDNGLKIRIYGTKGAIEWEQETPNVIKICMANGPVQIFSRGNGYLYPEAAELSRIPSGHPEGYYIGFANVYNAFLSALIKKQAGESLTAKDLDFPDVLDGVQGIKFIHACVDSSKNGAVWVDIK